MDTLLQLGFLTSVLTVAYLIGGFIERQHFADLRGREVRHRRHLAVTTCHVPSNAPVICASLVTGSVVVSLDYFKRFVAGLQGIIGGRISTYETLLERARREALLRMREAAIEQGYDMVINVRLETSRLAAAGGDGRGTAGVEIVAFGTALKT